MDLCFSVLHLEKLRYRGRLISLLTHSVLLAKTELEFRDFLMTN